MYASPDYYKKTFVGVISADSEVLTRLIYLRSIESVALDSTI